MPSPHFDARYPLSPISFSPPLNPTSSHPDPQAKLIDVNICFLLSTSVKSLSESPHILWERKDLWWRPLCQASLQVPSMVELTPPQSAPGFHCLGLWGTFNCHHWRDEDHTSTHVGRLVTVCAPDVRLHCVQFRFRGLPQLLFTKRRVIGMKRVMRKKSEKKAKSSSSSEESSTESSSSSSSTPVRKKKKKPTKDKKRESQKAAKKDKDKKNSKKAKGDSKKDKAKRKDKDKDKDKDKEGKNAVKEEEEEEVDDVGLALGGFSCTCEMWVWMLWSPVKSARATHIHIQVRSVSQSSSSAHLLVRFNWTGCQSVSSFCVSVCEAVCVNICLCLMHKRWHPCSVHPNLCSKKSTTRRSPPCRLFPCGSASTKPLLKCP